MKKVPRTKLPRQLHDFNSHELMDRTMLVAEVFDTFVVGHPKLSRKLKKDAERILGDICDLYQKLESRSL